ncbi:hypothetical protein PHLGIDRAFT_121393 [Phlebiopsis gigantea 11061_1 CR5-6]|uniref:Uncharacterized protein n=1 Tax=Phlebiopsis gigantea (strain 11061_1 CR5-6) TaxID=745531 RepID=A0A0C3PE18_PHLG1|nr:hypothetical protein PHLGIDRAFT_121393 [Phlebiopsis gigantea 11061_1 CR5-6]
MFSFLSPDIALYTLSFLPLPDVVKLYALSRNVFRFLTENEATIYHQLAIIHRFVTPGIALEDAVESERAVGGLLDGVTTWKELCRRWGTLQHRWSGHGPLLEGGYCPYKSDVREFRLDEQERTILAIEETSPTPTMCVRAIESGKQIWSLPTVTRLEVSGSFLLLWRDRGGIEIWKRAKDAVHASKLNESPLRIPSPLAATSEQLKLSPFTVDDTHRPSDFRGYYLPHGFLPSFTGQHFRITHFRAPLLAVVDGEAPRTIQLYDVEQGTLLRRFDLDAIVRDNTQGLRPQDSVLFDIDLSETHLCACLDSALVVVSLQATDISGLSSSSDASAKIPAMVYIDGDHSAIARHRAYQLSKDGVSSMAGSEGAVVQTGESLSTVKVWGSDAMEGHSVVPPGAAEALPGDEWRRAAGFISARFSPDGQHIIAGTVFSVLYLLPDFIRILDGTALADSVVQKLNLGEPVRDLYWGVHKFKEPGDTFILDLNPRYYSDPHDSTASLSAAKVFRLRDITVYRSMRLRRTGLWFVSNVTEMHRNVRKRAEEQEQTWMNGSQTDGLENAPLDVQDRGKFVSVCFVDFGDPVLGNPL